MAIGDIQLGSQSIAPSQARGTPQAFGAGVGVAMQNLGGQVQAAGVSVAAMNEYLARKKKAQAQLDADTALARWSGEQDRAIEQSAHSVAPGAHGYTNNTYEGLRKSGDEFLKGIDPTLVPEYKARVESFVQGRTTSAFKFEQDSADAHFVTQIQELTTQGQNEVYKSPDAFEHAFDFIKDSIGKTTLPPEKKEALLQQSFNALASTDFQRRAERAATGIAPIGPTDGSDVVAPGMPGYARGALNAIASTESPDYATINGGGKFEDFSDHPRKRVDRPNGEFSTAAGRYQMIASTWDRAKRALSLPDFSAVSQDRGAWYVAQSDFRSHTGRSLDQVLQSNDPIAILGAKKVLENTWEGLKGMSDDKWLAYVHTGMQVGGTGDAQSPNLWGDPKYAGLDFDTKMQLQNAATATLTHALTLQKQQDAEQQTNVYNSMVEGVGSGALKEPDVELAISNGDITDAAKVSKLRAMVSDQRKIRESLEKTVARVADTTQVFTTSAADKKDLDLLYQKGGLETQIGAMDPQGPQSLSSLVERTGVVPPRMAKQLDQMSVGTPEQQAYALNIASQLSVSNPEAFAAAATDDMEARTSFWRTSKQYNVDDNAAIAQYQDYRSPEKAALRERYGDEADKNLKKKSVGDALKVFNDKWLGFIPGTGSGAQLPGDTGSQALLYNDYAALYQQYYPLMQGDEGKTNDMVSKLMHKVWGVNTVDGSNRLMKYAPNAAGSGFQPVDGSLSWMDRQIRDTLHMTAGDQYQLTSDGQTAAEFAQGKPSYLVMRQDSLGRWFPAMREDNPHELLRVHPTIDENMKSDIEDKVHVQQLEDKISHTTDLDEGMRLLDQLDTLQEKVNMGPKEDVRRRIAVFADQEAKWRATRDSPWTSDAMKELFDRNIVDSQAKRIKLESMLAPQVEQGAQ